MRQRRRQGHDIVSPRAPQPQGLAGGRTRPQIPWQIAVVAMAASTAWLAMTRPFALDELTYAHTAWQIHQGLVPYADFFAHHPPLLWQLLAPLHGLVERASEFLTLSRLALIPIWLSQLGLLAWLARDAGPWRWLAPLAALTTQTWADHAIELRPDGLAWTLTLAAVALARAQRRLWVFAGGVAWVAAAWASPKAVVLGGATALLVLRDAVAPSPRALSTWPRTWLAGAGAAVVSVAAWLAHHDLSGPAWRWMIQWAWAYERGYEGFPFWTWAGSAFAGAAGWASLAGLGVASLAGAGRRGEGSPVALWLLATGPLTWLVVATQRAAYPYSYLPALAWTAMAAAHGAAAVAAWIRVRAEPRRAAALAAAVIAAPAISAALVALDGSDRPPPSKRMAQLEVLDTLERLVPPGVPVFDHTGSGVRRPSPHFYGFTNPWVLAQQGAALAAELPAALADRGCMAVVRDAAWERQPPALQAALEATYAPWDGDILLWGRALAGGGALRSAHAVAIPRDGSYFVEPAAAVTAGAIHIDGAIPAEATIQLTRGRHRVEVGGPGVWLLWLPADGQRWRPRPGLSPRLRHVL